MILKMGWNPYANDIVSCLSGGVRRRLEVAIAFVAGSKTVILGMSKKQKQSNYFINLHVFFIL
jgi:hypothetical protein